MKNKNIESVKELLYRPQQSLYLEDTKLDIVDFPTPAFPKNTFPVNWPVQLLVIIPSAPGWTSDKRFRSPRLKDNNSSSSLSIMVPVIFS